MSARTMPDALPGGEKAYCEGNQDRCSGDTCPIFGTLTRPSRDGKRRVRGCDDPTARGKRNTRKGDDKGRKARRALGLTGNSRHEEGWAGALRTEAKAGGKARPVQTAYENSRAQSEVARPIGDNRPFIASFAPDGTGHLYFVVRADDLQAVAFALVEAMAS